MINQSDKLIRWIVPWLILSMVIISFSIVVFRYLFERGWVWMQELVVYLHAFSFLLAASHALARNVHVRVDIFYRNKTSISRSEDNPFSVNFYFLTEFSVC